MTVTTAMATAMTVISPAASPVGRRGARTAARRTALRVTGALRVAGALSVAGVAGLTNLACAPGEVSGENALPTGIPDPASVQTPAGTLAFYRRIVATTPRWLDPLIFETGILTDELSALPLPLFSSSGSTSLDSRTNLNGEGHYNNLHRLRAQAREARGFVASYLTDADTAADLRGHLYALEGYAELFLADLFCSGIPLSTVDYGADYTLAPGSRTDDVYRHAAALFDTALAAFRGSVHLQPLAAVGRGRALLALGRYAEAAAAVAAVPDGYQSPVTFVPGAEGPIEFKGSLQNVAGAKSGEGYLPGLPGVADQEGFKGLPYRTSADPRVPVTLLGQDYRGNPLYFPTKYPTEGAVTFLLADAVEARLIEAEAALQGQLGGADWLTRLNALRTDGRFEVNSETGDTLWQAGTGGVDSLRPLADPGTPEGRVDLLFRERAFWLYLTGHRQGDLRRLIRRPEYRREAQSVYPTGSYPGGTGTYGTETFFPVPATERQLNPKYTGCVPGDA